MEQDKHQSDIVAGMLKQNRDNGALDPAEFSRYQVKPGLRNADGTGVVAGLTRICNVHGYLVNEGERAPIEGRLIYRGYDVEALAKDMMSADEEINTVLIVGGYRNGDFVDYTDKDMSMMYNLGAGAGALILQKGMDRNLVLGSHIMGDGSLARDAGVEIGGICRPFTPENIDEGYRSLRLMDAAHMKARLNEVSVANWYHCIDESLRKSGGLTRADIGYLAILHFKRSQHEAMVAELGLTPEQTVYLEEYGHIGQIDQILSLALGLEQGKIQDGTVVTMIAAGIGYVWASTCIRWGQAK